MQTHRAGNPDRKHRSKNSKAEIRSGNLQRGIIRHRAGAPGICPARFAVSVNYTIKCSRKKKRSSYESLVECNHHKSKNQKETRMNCKHLSIEARIRKISASALILSSRDVPVAGNNRVQKREAQSCLVTGANCLHTVRLEDAELDARCTAGHAAKAAPRQGQCVKSYEARCRSSSEWFPASSLVCFCITCQAFFLSVRKPASAPCAARISRTARPPSRTRPQTRTKPHLCPPITGTNPNAPGRSAASDRNGPARRRTGFPQSLHRLFHIFAGFPQRLSFPLAFFERDRVRSSEQCVLTAQ